MFENAKSLKSGISDHECLPLYILIGLSSGVMSVIVRRYGMKVKLYIQQIFSIDCKTKTMVKKFMMLLVNLH